VPRKTIGTVGALHLDRDLRAEWKPAYKRGYMMQASLSIVGGALKRHPAHEMALHDLRGHPAHEMALHDLRGHAD
jgi:hypothetical protein